VRAVRADEVQVIPAHLEALAVVREPEADHRALDVAKVEDRLGLNDLRQRPVGRLLSRDGSRVHELELAVDPHRARDGPAGKAHVHQSDEVIV